MATSSAATLPAPSTPVVRINATASPLEWPERRASVEPVDPRVRVAFSRIADQLPVEMFARGATGLNDMLRPGVSLFVPRGLLLPHLAEGIAAVKWEVVADQFPRDELLLTNAEIAKRLPNGSLRLPLDEVMPQIPAELLTLSKQPAAAQRTEELPPPAQLHVPPPVTAAVEVHEIPGEAEAEATEPEVAKSEGVEQEVRVADMEVADVAEAEIVPATAPALAMPPVVPTLVAPAPVKALVEPEPPKPVTAVVLQALEHEPAREPRPYENANGIVASHGRTAEARRIAARLAPVMNGLEIGERDGAGTLLFTAIAPTLSDDAVVAAALRVAPWLFHPRLPERVSQATLAASETTIVLTPFESIRGDALLVAAVASRGSLAWLERLSRSAAGELPSVTRNGAQAPEDSNPARELRPAVVPPSIRELASFFTSVGPLAPAVLCDVAGMFRVCLFAPGALEPGPLARLARDLFVTLEGTKIEPVSSVTLRLETHRLVVRTLGSSGGQTTLLAVVGSMARPGLTRLALERVAKVIGG